MAAATESALATLHELVASTLAARLASDICTAADISAAIKFLKDNNITATPEANEKLGELEEELNKSREGVTPADDAELQQALDNLLHFPGGLHAGVG